MTITDPDPSQDRSHDCPLSSTHPLTCHPLYKDVDVSVVLRRSEAADNVGMVESSEHGHLLGQPIELLILLLLGVTNIADLHRGAK